MIEKNKKKKKVINVEKLHKRSLLTFVFFLNNRYYEIN